MKKRRLEALHKKQPQMGSIEEETLRDTESRIRQRVTIAREFQD